MWRYAHHLPKPETTNAVLLYLRAQIVREGLEGLEHAEALLRLRGVDLDAHPIPAKRNRRFRNGHLRRALLAILREQGPMTARRAGERLHARFQDMGRDQAIRSAKDGMYRLGMAGLVVREGRLWRLGHSVGWG